MVILSLKFALFFIAYFFIAGLTTKPFRIINRRFPDIGLFDHWCGTKELRLAVFWPVTLPLFLGVASFSFLQGLVMRKGTFLLRVCESTDDLKYGQTVWSLSGDSTIYVGGGRFRYFDSSVTLPELKEFMGGVIFLDNPQRGEEV